jgi:alpha-glucosidase (family GH31 glycosyl hydrolase)
MCRNVRSIEWHQKTYHEILWDYPFNKMCSDMSVLCQDILVAPVLEATAELVNVTFPPG